MYAGILHKTGKIVNFFALIPRFTVIKLDFISKNEIYDKTIIWCSKSFPDSKSAIRIKKCEGGNISRKLYYLSTYKMTNEKIARKVLFLPITTLAG